VSLGIWIAIGLATGACVLALVALLRRPVHGRHAMTMDLSLTLLRYDEGLGLLAAQARRSDRWWENVDPMDQHVIDRALSMWDLAAWYVATGRVERQAFVDVFRWDIVDLWERAYPYVLHRRVDQPSLWSSLTDLYVDAYETGRESRPPQHVPRHIPPRSVSPESAQTEHLEPLDRPTKTPSTPAPVPAAPSQELSTPEPVPHPVLRAADVGWPAPPRPLLPATDDSWVRALQEAGPVVPPATRRGASLRMPIRSMPEVVVEELRADAGVRPARPARLMRLSQPSLELDQVIDLTEAQTTVRSSVGG
jgi:hypothetical protein